MLIITSMHLHGQNSPYLLPWEISPSALQGCVGNVPGTYFVGPPYQSITIVPVPHVS